MHPIPTLLLLALTTTLAGADILVFSKTAGYRHKSIPDGIAMLEAICARNGWRMTATEDAAAFTDAGLAGRALVVFLNTSGDVLEPAQEAAFERYMRRGGGLQGIHAASDTEYDWPFYAAAIGAQFSCHPAIQPARLRVDHRCGHPAVAGLPAVWSRTDEWYNFRAPVQPHANVLVRVDTASYEGSTMGDDHPVSWYHHYDGGRVFYTAMGHTEASYREPAFSRHVEEGMRWAAGFSQVPLPWEWTPLLDPALSHWDRFLGVPHPAVGFPGYGAEDLDRPPLGLHNDPRAVFTVQLVDGEPVLRISGEIFGSLMSKQAYADYHLRLHYRWGAIKWPPRADRPRNSGLLYHGTGPNGAFANAWLHSLEMQMMEGNAGDLFRIGTTALDAPAVAIEGGFRYDPAGEVRVFGAAEGAVGPRCQRAASAAESEIGEWNTLELIVIGDRSLHIVNGVVVLAGRNARLIADGVVTPLTRGRIQLQSEGSELFVKGIEIRALHAFPEAYRAHQP
jgi:type 1 glutamine amidotransferase